MPNGAAARLVTKRVYRGSAGMPGTIFISHRAEYANLVRELKKAIETTSRGQIDVIISEDLSGAENWREAIKSQLQRAKYLFLVYGAPYEDWSWCFYEAGYFAGTHPGPQQQRSTYCIARPKVDPPGPLSDLQMVTDKERLITDLIDIYNRNNVEYDSAKLRESHQSGSERPVWKARGVCQLSARLFHREGRRFRRSPRSARRRRAQG